MEIPNLQIDRRNLLIGVGAAAATTLLLPTPAQAVAAPLTKWKSTGGSVFETDTFYIARAWNKEYRQYTFRVTWGGNRDVKYNGRYYRHKLESTRIKADGKMWLYTKPMTTRATPETYWLNVSRAQFTLTTRITNLSNNSVWYRSALIIF